MEYDIMLLPLRVGFFVLPGCAKPNGSDKTPLGEGGTRAFPCERPNNLKWEVPLIMANDARVKITLVCTECKQRNYDTKKNKKNDPDRLELKKFCRFCRKHTLHKESK